MGKLVFFAVILGVGQLTWAHGCTIDLTVALAMPQAPPYMVLSDQREVYNDFVKKESSRFTRMLAQRFSPEIAQVAMQEALFKLYKNLNRFEARKNAALSTYFGRICINEALMVVRSEKRHQINAISGDAPIDEDSSMTFFDRAEAESMKKGLRNNPFFISMAKKDQMMTVMKALDKLSAVTKEILLLKLFGTTEGSAVELYTELGSFYDFSNDEMVEYLGISLPAVKSRLCRAYRELRDLLALATPKSLR